MPATSYEGGLRPYRLEYVRETTFETLESNPSWNLFSDAVQSFDPGIDPGTEGQRTLGDPDFADHFTSTMSATPTVEYHLQQKTSSGDTLEDSSGNANDALTDGLVRDSDNRLQNSHQIVRRMTQSDLEAGNTVNGSTSKDTRQYIVYIGTLVNDVSVSVDPSAPMPIMVTLEYTCRRADVYKIDQPPSDGTGKQIAVKSTDSGDTSQSVTIEGVDAADAAAEESVTLSGTTLVDTDTAFQEIDAIELSAETTGDVEVYEDDDATNDTVTQGDQLAVIPGQSSFDHSEGALGIPALGTGSHASSIGQSYETPQATTIQKPGGSDLSDEVITTEISVPNNVSEDGTTTGPRPVVIANERTPQADVTVTGEREYFDLMTEALQTTIEDFELDLGGGETIRLDSAAVLDSGGSEDVGQGMRQTDATIEGQGLTIVS